MFTEIRHDHPSAWKTAKITPRGGTPTDARRTSDSMTDSSSTRSLIGVEAAFDPHDAAGHETAPTISVEIPSPETTPSAGIAPTIPQPSSVAPTRSACATTLFGSPTRWPWLAVAKSKRNGPGTRTYDPEILGTWPDQQHESTTPSKEKLATPPYDSPSDSGTITKADQQHLLRNREVISLQFVVPN